MADIVYIDGTPNGSKYDGAENILVRPRAATHLDDRAMAIKFFLGDFLKREWQIMPEGIWLELKGNGYLAEGPAMGGVLFTNTMIRLMA